jgi:hypothetical protein
MPSSAKAVEAVEGAAVSPAASREGLGFRVIRRVVLRVL